MAIQDTIVSLEALMSAYDAIRSSPHVVRTPCIQLDNRMFNVPASSRIFLKLENMQTTGNSSIVNYDDYV